MKHTSLTVVRSHQDALRERFLTLEPGRHRLLGSYPWLEWVKRETNQPDLFLYYHLHHNTFVLAKWLVPRDEAIMPICQELESFSGSPQGSWPSDLMAPEVLLDRLRPQDEVLRRLQHQAAENQAAEHAKRDSLRTAKHEYATSLTRKGYKHEAEAIRTNRVPYTPKELTPPDLREALFK